MLPQFLVFHSLPYPPIMQRAEVFYLARALRPLIERQGGRGWLHRHSGRKSASRWEGPLRSNKVAQTLQAGLSRWRAGRRGQKLPNAAGLQKGLRAGSQMSLKAREARQASESKRHHDAA